MVVIELSVDNAICRNMDRNLAPFFVVSGTGPRSTVAVSSQTVERVVRYKNILTITYFIVGTFLVPKIV